MKVLAVESSSMVAATAIVDNDKLVAEFVLNHRKTHSQKLMPLVEEALESVGLTPGDIDVFAVAQGPGSFTGLRIGISTIKALAQAVNKPVVGIPTLDGLAFNLACCGDIICPIMDARREQVYTSIYKWQPGSVLKGEESQLKRLDDYMAVPVLELIEKLKEIGGPVVFNGDGVPVYRDIIVDRMGDSARFAPPTCVMQRASSIAWLAFKKALEGDTQSYVELKPFYLRKSQAEQKYEKANER